MNNGKSKRGVFWVIDDKLLACPYEEGAVIGQIMEAFGIPEQPVIHNDGSEHYKCHLDRQ